MIVSLAGTETDGALLSLWCLGMGSPSGGDDWPTGDLFRMLTLLAFNPKAEYM